MARCLRDILGKAIEENCFQERLINLNAAVEVNKPEFAKPVHEEAYAGARRADHLGQGWRQQSYRQLCCDWARCGAWLGSHF